MHTTIRNPEQLANHIANVSKMVEDGNVVNLSYDFASKPKTKAQVGFFFKALCGQITDYFNSCGFNVDVADVKHGLYQQVSEIVPEMVCDKMLFGGAPRIKHLPEMDRKLMSDFINGVFTVLDTNPMYAGIKLSPDTFFNWVFHLEENELRIAQTQELPKEDEQYLSYRRTQPCIICGVQHRSEAHHIRDTRFTGTAIKAPDWASISLCHSCHMNIAHGTGFKERMSWLPIDIFDFCRLCYLRWKKHN